MDTTLKQAILEIVATVLIATMLLALGGFIYQVSTFNKRMNPSKVELTLEERKAAYIRVFINSCSSFTVKTAEEYLAKDDMPYLECTVDRLNNEI